MSASIFRLGLLILCLITFVASTSPSEQQYVRPPPSPVLDLAHPSLQPGKGGPHHPEQLHLALAGPGSIAVSWVTRPQDDSILAAAVQAGRNSTRGDVGLGKHHKKDKCQHLSDYPLKPTAQLGLSSGQYTLEVEGWFTCYSSSDYDSGALHTALLGRASPLAPSTRYYYRAGDPNLGWSEENSFVTALPVSPDSVPYKLGLIGDLGQTEDSAKTLNQLSKLDVASVLNVGDLSYADSYQPRWDSWGRLLESHASKVPWMHIEGNHEIEVMDGDTGFVAYESRFWYPAEESGSHSPFYYSYETGPLHVVMLGCYVEYSADSEQAAWLRRDLATVDRRRTPWVVVGMHAPWYNSNTAHQGEVNDMRDDLEPILYQHGVDIVFAGHVHAYEASDGGVLEGKLDKCGPVYVTIGDGGNREGPSPDWLKKPVWSRKREASFGMGSLTVHNASHAVWHWHRNQDKISRVADEHWLVRNLDCQGEVAGSASHNSQRSVSLK